MSTVEVTHQAEIDTQRALTAALAAFDAAYAAERKVVTEAARCKLRYDLSPTSRTRAALIRANSEVTHTRHASKLAGGAFDAAAEVHQSAFFAYRSAVAMTAFAADPCGHATIK